MYLKIEKVILDCSIMHHWGDLLLILHWYPGHCSYGSHVLTINRHSKVINPFHITADNPAWCSEVIAAGNLARGGN